MKDRRSPFRLFSLITFLLISCPKKQELSLRVYFIDVGHGDCILIQTPDDGIKNNGIAEGINILIDGGEKNAGQEIVVPFLSRLGIDTIQILIATHFHSDHIGGLIPVLEHFPVKLVLTHTEKKEGERDASLHKEFLKRVAEENCRQRQAVAGDTIFIGRELKAIILNPKILDEEENNNSIVLKIEYSSIGLLFTGDIEGKKRKEKASEIRYAERRLVDNYPGLLKSHLLKVAHHGSETSSTEEFLKIVSPKVAIITGGRKRFGGVVLPDSSVIFRLRRLGAKVYRTDFEDTDYKTAAGDDHIKVLVSPDSSLQVNYLRPPLF